MASTLDGKLVVAISSRALFDFEEENQVFEQNDDRAYMDLQLQRLEQPAPPGVAFSLVKKLLAFNQPGDARVEVVILSRNDPVSGMRVFRSAQHYGLDIQRGSFTRGQPPWRYLKPLNANLFLSAHLSDVRAALDAGVPAAQVYPHSAHASEAHRKVSMRFSSMKKTSPHNPCLTAHSNLCWWRCTVCSKKVPQPSASAPHWSPRAAHPPMSAPSAP